MASENDFKALALIVASALFMENLDGSIIVTALPQIARAFGTSPIDLSVAVSSYLLSVAVFIPASGWIADRFGARTIFLAAIAVFTLASVLCGLSHGLAAFAIVRALQGIGGAMMVPVGRLVLMRNVSKADMVSAMAYLTVPAVLGPVLGPPLGGFIVTYASWRWIFFLNVPIGVIGAFLVLRLVPNHKEDVTPPFDWLGFALSGLALAGLVYSVELASHGGLSPGLLLPFLVGAGALLLYLRHARARENPILDLKLLHIPTFRLSFFAGNLFRISAGAIPFLLPMMLQAGFGLSAFSSGVLTFISAVGSLLMRVLAGYLLKALGFRRALVLNGFLCALLMLAHGFLTPSTPVLLMPALFFAAGFCRGLQYNGIAALNFADVSKAQMSRATSLASTAQQLSQSLGVATGALFLSVTIFGFGQDRLGPDSFAPAFSGIAIIAALSAILFLRLARSAGSDVSGHGVK